MHKSLRSWFEIMNQNVGFEHWVLDGPSWPNSVRFCDLLGTLQKYSRVFLKLVHTEYQKYSRLLYFWYSVCTSFKNTIYPLREYHLRFPVMQFDLIPQNACTGGSRLMRISLLRISLLRISLLRISLLRFFKAITKIWLMRFYGLFILLLRT